MARSLPVARKLERMHEAVADVLTTFTDSPYARRPTDRPIVDFTAGNP